jgi:hypothetical protein
MSQVPQESPEELAVQAEIINRYRALADTVAGPAQVPRSADGTQFPVRSQPTVTAVSPTLGKANTKVSIKGTHLETASEVFFGKTPTKAVGDGDGGLLVTVPSGIPVGTGETKVKVAVLTELGTAFAPGEFTVQ